MGYTNSSLVDCTVKSPNHSGTRTHKIDRITPHCVVGQLSAEAIGGCFKSESRQASCNYGIGYDGKVCLVVDEQNRSWCSSSNSNDQRAITIECASDKTSPYAFKDACYNKLVKLCIDICKRNNLTKVLWFSDKDTALNYTPKTGECVLTVHRWFSSYKSCPGDWLFNRMSKLASEINNGLGGSSSSNTKTTNDSNTSASTLTAGTKLSLNNASFYGSSTATSKSSTKSGIYYVWSSVVVNNRIRITNSASNVNKSGKVTAWIDYSVAKNSVSSGNSSCSTTSGKSYKVKVTADILNIRKGAGTNYATVAQIKDKGTYTIVEESTGTGATKWGLLKSYEKNRNGWVSLDYCKKL